MTNEIEHGFEEYEFDSERHILDLLHDIDDAAKIEDGSVYQAIAAHLDNEDIERVIKKRQSSRRALSELALNGVIQRNVTETPTYTDAIDILVCKNAMDVWSKCMQVVSSKEDVAAWHRLLDNDEFHALHESHRKIRGFDTLVSSAGGGEIVNGILRAGSDDLEYLQEMAAYWAENAQHAWDKFGKGGRKRTEISGINEWDSQSLDSKDLTAMGVLGAIHHRIRYLATDIRISHEYVGADHSEKDPREFFVREMYRLADFGRNFPSDPHKILGVVRHMTIDPDRSLYITGVNNHLLTLIEGEISGDKRINAVDYFAASSELLMKTLNFAQQEENLNDPTAAKMYGFLSAHLSGRGNYATERPTIKGIQALANGLVGPINDLLPPEARINPIKQNTVEDIYDAFDRILFALNASVDQVDNANNDLIHDMSEIITSVLRMGIPAVRQRQRLLASMIS